MASAAKTPMKKSGGKRKKLVLLDSHAIIHRAYHALPDFVSSKGEPTGGIYGLCSMLLKIITDLKPDYIVAAYDLPGPTYRHQAYTEYKAGRTKADEDLIAQIQRSRDVFKAFSIPIYDCPGFEADDILGTVVSKVSKDTSVEIVIASGDMDTLQLIQGERVTVYTLKKGISDTILYDTDRVHERFGFGPERIPDYKGLSGDPSDNIVGVPGIGDKTATDLITKFGSVEDIYKTLKKTPKKFAQAGIKERIVNLLREHEEEARFSKELATIRTDAPINFALPKKEWAETVELSAVLKLFDELEFRTIGARARTVIDAARGTPSTVPRPEAQDVMLVSENVPQELLKEILVLVSLINSNLTSPELEDAYRMTNTHAPEDAKAALIKMAKEREMLSVYENIERPLIPVIESMERWGIKVDVKYLQELSIRFHKTLSALEKNIWGAAGMEFNINSPKQLGEVLFNKLGLKAARQKRTGTGALSTKESELEKLRDLHPIIGAVLEHREYQKLLSTYIDSIPSLVATDGRLHTHFVSIGAATGRMASRDPNLQNIPHKSELGREIRKAFVAEKGFSLVALDYSQIELRIAAFLSGDKALIEIFKKGEDIHSAVASEVFGVPRERVTSDMRRQAKVINFGIIYGMGIVALQQSLGTTRAEAQKFYADYFERFKGLAAYLDRTKEDAHRQGFTKTLFGRRRYFEGLKSKLPYVRASAERMAINAPIQGTEADIIKLAMVHIHELVNKKGLSQDVRMLLQVHDELVFEIKTDLVASVVPEIKSLMEQAVDPKETAGVVCRVDAHQGTNWEDMEKI